MAQKGFLWSRSYALEKGIENTISRAAWIGAKPARGDRTWRQKSTKTQEILRRTTDLRPRPGVIALGTRAAQRSLRSRSNKLSTRVLKAQRGYFFISEADFLYTNIFCSNKLSTRVLKSQRSFFSLFPKPISLHKYVFASTNQALECLSPNVAFVFISDADFHYTNFPTKGYVA